MVIEWASHCIPGLCILLNYLKADLPSVSVQQSHVMTHSADWIDTLQTPLDNQIPASSLNLILFFFYVASLITLGGTAVKSIYSETASTQQWLTAAPLTHDGSDYFCSLLAFCTSKTSRLVFPRVVLLPFFSHKLRDTLKHAHLVLSQGW